MSKVRLLLFMSIAALASACSPNAEPPSINSPVKPVNVEACRHASLNLRVLNATSARSLVNCLNGDNEALKPYKKFLDEMDSDKLDQLLQIYNLHIAKDDDRLNQALDTIDRMHKKGWLKSFMKDLQVMTETGTSRALLPVLSRFFESEGDNGRIDPNLSGLYKYVVKLIDHNAFWGIINASADVGSSLRGKLLAALISSDNASSVLNSDQAVDLVAGELMKSFDDNTFHELATHLSDPNLNLANSMKVLTASEISDLADLLAYLPQGGGNRIEKLRRLVAATNVPLNCFKNGKRSRSTPNMLKMIGQEKLKRAPGPASDAFSLQTLPLLLMTTNESCDYSPDVTQNFTVFTDMARDGYASGDRALFKILLYGNRFEEMTAGASSPYLGELAPVLQEFGIRGGTRLGLEIFSNEFSATDAKGMAAGLEFLIDGDLTGDGLNAWIAKNFVSPTRDVLFQDLSKLPPGKKTLADLSLYVVNDPGQDQVLRDLKNVVAQGPFTGSSELSALEVAKKFLKNDAQRRQELKDLARAFVRSMADRRGGVGDMLGVIAQATGLSTDNPFQKIFRDTLADDKLMDVIAPLLWEITRQKNFADAVDFTGKLAASGDLEKILEFLTELFKNSNSPGLIGAPPASAYVKPVGDGNSFSSEIKPYHQLPPITKYDACNGLAGSLFDSQGNNLFLGLKCMNSAGLSPVLGAVADQLKAAGMLPEAAAFFREVAVSSPHLNGTLNELQTLLSSGDADTLLKLFAISGDSHYNIPYGLDGILNDAFRHKGMPGTLKLLGKISQLNELSVAAPAAIDVLEKPAHKTFSSNTDYKMRICVDPNDRRACEATIANLKAQIKQFAADGGWNWTDSQVNDAYLDAAYHFMMHDDVWKYGTGPYTRLSESEWRRQIYAFLEDIVRSQDLPEFVAALQDIAANMNPNEFIKRSVLDRRAAVHYSPDGKPMVRILTLWEQFEELVEDADFNVPVAGHAGISFDLAVVHATDFVSAMNKQYGLTKDGIKYTTVIGQKDKANRFRSMLGNFAGLFEIAKSGELRIFQRLYRSMYNATPQGDREKKDAKANHLRTLTFFNNIQLFSTLAVALNNAYDQKQFDNIVNGVFGMSLLVTKNDIEPLRQSILALISRAKRGDNAPLEALFDKINAVEQNPKGYQELKDSLFALAPALNRLGVTPTGLFKALPSLVTQPKAWNDFLDKLIEDGSAPGGKVFTVANNLLSIDEQSKNAFQKIGNVVLADDPQTGESYLPSVVAMAADGYAVRPGDYARLNKEVNDYVNDPRVKATHPSEFLKTVFHELDGQQGIGQLTGSLLSDDVQRQRFIRLGYLFTKNSDIAGLSGVLIGLINDGDVDSALHFIFDNLQPNSLTSNHEVRSRRH